MGLMREAALVTAKDLRIEARSRVVTNQVLPFGAVVLLLFGLTLDTRRDALRAAAPGLFWVSVTLAALLALSRSAAVEATSGRDHLRLLGIDGGAVFLGKAAAVAAQLLLLEAVLAVGVVVLFDLSIHPSVEVIAVLILACLTATAGLAAVGTIFGGLTGSLRLRETLLPMLVLPIVAPVLMGGSRAWDAALRNQPGDAWLWIQVMAVFALLYGTLGVVAYGALLEES